MWFSLGHGLQTSSTCGTSRTWPSLSCGWPSRSYRTTHTCGTGRTWRSLSHGWPSCSYNTQPIRSTCGTDRRWRSLGRERPSSNNNPGHRLPICGTGCTWRSLGHGRPSRSNKGTRTCLPHCVQTPVSIGWLASSFAHCCHPRLQTSHLRSLHPSYLIPVKLAGPTS